MSNHISGVRLRAIGLGAACLLTLIACGDASTGKAMPRPDITSTSPNDDLGALLGGETSAPEIGALASVTVVERGEDPQTQPTADPQVGDRYTTTTHQATTVTIGGEESPPIPVTMVASTEVKDVTAAAVTIRSIFVDVEVDERTLPEDLVADLEASFEPLHDLAVTVDQTPSGAVLDTRFSLPDNASPAARQTVEHMAGSMTATNVPYPAEPIGEGAVWSVVESVESGGLTIEQTTTYVLEDLDGDDYRISFELEGKVVPATLGADVRLVRGSLTGSGETYGSFGDLYPTEGSSEVETVMVTDEGGRRKETGSSVELTATTVAD